MQSRKVTLAKRPTPNPKPCRKTEGGYRTSHATRLARSRLCVVRQRSLLVPQAQAQNLDSEVFLNPSSGTLESSVNPCEILENSMKPFWNPQETNEIQI